MGDAGSDDQAIHVRMKVSSATQTDGEGQAQSNTGGPPLDADSGGSSIVTDSGLLNLVEKTDAQAQTDEDYSMPSNHYDHQ